MQQTALPFLNYDPPFKTVNHLNIILVWPIRLCVTNYDSHGAHNTIIFIIVAHYSHAPSIIWLLTGYDTSTCRYLEIINSCQEALLLKLLTQLKQVLYRQNISKFKRYIEVVQHKKYRACDNNASTSKNLRKIEKPMKNEDHNKHALVLPFWIEYFISDLFFTPQGLSCKGGKIDSLEF